MTPISPRGAIAFVDVETTGGHAAYHRVTEIGLVAMRDGEVEFEWSTLVNPECHIPAFIQSLTGISNEMVATAPRFADIAPQLLAHLEGRIFVAHNARFDYGFIRGELRRAGHRFSAPLGCTVKLSRRLYPDTGRHNLDSIIARHALQCPQRHRALPDAQVLAQFWRHMLAELPTSQFDAVLREVTHRPSLPPQLPVELLDELPEASGVYRFYGAGDALIYIGKAKNIRERVLEHFASAARNTKSRKLSDQTQRIEWTETAGELGALLLEARMVRQLQPVYNRHLKAHDSFTWMVGDDGSPPMLLPLQDRNLDGDAYGLFRTEREANKALTEIARANKLCLKTLGLEPGSGSCFGYQIGRCRGTCLGEESAAMHNARVKLALAGERLKTWPYRGPIALRDGGGFALAQWHIVDRWQYLGSVSSDEAEVPSAAYEMLEAHAPQSFDIDAYRILTRHLRDGRQKVQVLSAARGTPSRSSLTFDD